VIDLDPKTIVSGATRLAERFGDEAYYAALCVRSGMVTPTLPHRTAQMLLALERYGMLGGALDCAAIQHGDRPAIIDERGEISYRELRERAESIAGAWAKRGLRAGDGVAIIARNHRGFLEAFFAATRCGARIILLNTSFSARQVAEVAEREGTDLLVIDEEYEEMLSEVEPRLGRFIAWADSEPDASDTLESLIAERAPAPGRPGEWAKVVILTSGTTGTPKGAGRSLPLSLAPIGGLLSKVPFRSRETTLLCAPVFHALGFSQMVLAVALGSTMVMERKFDPSRALDLLERHRASTMIAVPVMLQRMIGLDEEHWRDRRFDQLRIIFLSGSQLGADLAERAMKRFGPVIYNLYGSTEVAFATIATPEDLRADPSTVGRVVHGSVVKVLDEQGQELPGGSSGRVFVGNTIQFEGYTGGGDKERVAGLMASGDVGHFDQEGRLYIDGRDDEMIVSGGENVFPAEVEELLNAHEKIADAAAIGVDDDEWGQRLKAFVVLDGSGSLSEEEVKAYVRDNLARYKVPREVVFLDELPRTSTGKVLKRELRDR
jgi:fatty-acyl-CoA synthase